MNKHEKRLFFGVRVTCHRFSPRGLITAKNTKRGRASKELLRAIVLLVIALPAILLGGEEKDDPLSPLPVGNFSVPVMTQISPLVSFGQLLIGEHDLLSQLSGSYTRGHQDSANEITPNWIYGIRNDLSVVLSVPFALNNRSGASHVKGIEDLLLQLEYGFYSKTYSDRTYQATVVANVQFPTGSSTKNPPTGAGSWSTFFGMTYAYMSFTWYAFLSPGVQITTTHHETKFGNAYLYQGGLARTIPALSPPGWVFDLMIELDGTYTEKNRIDGVIDPNSGGHVILATPSLWFSSKRWIFQGGPSFPLLQSLHGHQDKMRYTISYTLGIAFQF